MNYRSIMLLTTSLLLSALLQGAPAAADANAAAGNFIDGSDVSFWGFILVILITIVVLSKSTIRISKAVSEGKKKLLMLTILLSISFAANSQEASLPTANVNKLPELFFDPLTYLTGMLILLLVVTLYVLLKINMKLIKAILPEKEKVKEVVEENSIIKKPAFFNRTVQRMFDSVPVAHENDILLDHDYDGIKELDNNLPPWWKYGFYVTIVFAFVYMIYFHVSGSGKLQLDEYNQELQIAATQKEQRLKMLADIVNEETVLKITDAGELVTGKDLYIKNCAACHRPDGGGMVGPNLTDEFWIHGGGVKNIFKTIAHGVPAKGMISWESQLSPKQIQLVSSYILSIQGSKPDGAKEAQGELWVDSPSTTPDSLHKAGADSLIAQVKAIM